MSFAVGTLVRARGREWVVLPESDVDFVIVRPLGGTDDEVTGIHTGLEAVEAATLQPPSASDLGDHRSGRLLRDAVRLGFRNSAGPFRSFGKIACDPRPYQLVPLLMALRLDPVRLLIADDVGIGKTVEAGLIARELIDRGEASGLAVLCPPHLAEQWQRELREKFNLEAELVLPGTARRLEARCSVNQSLFDVYPYVIVSTDYIKSDRRREDFLRACPDLVIVDEAHTCAAAAERGPRHQRHHLLKGLAAKDTRHLILVTATPHSGKEDAFRSLLELLDASFVDLPSDLAGPANEAHRRKVAAHLVQRRRADIEHYLDADTPFPKRQEKEETYKLSPEYRRLFERALKHAKELVRDPDGDAFRQRVRWWSALALLRSIASSPAAAAATLRNRAGTAAADTVEEVDEIGRRTVLDPIDDEPSEGIDVIPGSDDLEDAAEKGSRDRLLDMARAAEALRGSKDTKLEKAKELVFDLLKEGYQPIVFCRFIPTAEYVADELRTDKRLSKGTEVVAVTGTLPPEDREARIEELGKAERRVLVCTDCLSEGINLQDKFNAVLHYDLSWNPTRHEQREGRVDRYGQPNKTVRVVTYYGVDNQIDGVVLDVLLKKHKKIRSSLGISVPVPADTEKVMAALLHGALLRGDASQLTLDLGGPEETTLSREWEAAADREKVSRTMFAQHGIKTDEVARELDDMRRTIGSGVEVERFVRDVMTGHGARIAAARPDGSVVIDVSETPTALRDSIRNREGELLRIGFAMPVAEGVRYLHRTHPIVEGLGSYVLDSALDPLLAGKGIARRAGVVRTRAVSRRTTVVLLRLRYHIVTKTVSGDHELLAEDWQVAGFEGPGSAPVWVLTDRAEALIDAKPDANIGPDVASAQVQRVIADLPTMALAFEQLARDRGDAILESHRRVRKASRWTGISQRIEPKLPVDVLGIYVNLPAD
jgi:superfamily II DNA or RNA helicase